MWHRHSETIHTDFSSSVLLDIDLLSVIQGQVHVLIESLKRDEKEKSQLGGTAKDHGMKKECLFQKDAMERKVWCWEN